MTAFLPPRVQKNLINRFGYYPRFVPEDIATKIEELWAARNKAKESEIDEIDIKMETIVVAYLISFDFTC